MSQIHAMSDDQVNTELRKMTAFIRQEALEKAREIHLKADEEFSIEKSKLVRSETSRMDTEYEKKFTQAGMSQQITKSTLANKQRLRILSARQELLDSLFEDANKKLSDTASKDKKKYEKVLSNLILEGLYALVNEKKVTLKCRKKDDDVVKKAADSAKEEFKKTMDKEVDVQLDKEKVPEQSAGGVIIVNSTGKIDINNTFEERLRLLETDALPVVRSTLFGENKNRKFRD
ncbi:probable vacuolar ATP synthase subunit E [Ramularia collo-cygni]|uniref:Probable vacuolar ATP synthase subunit E n=1 Tax=Ramularia collo-cygni TaxID=112498 RepID=A0A2D3VLQ6_9PEZI|nr:probable vacuolar ATP synthase subunit E [Ramularia collo-cygni]CZT24589.1 probable vacuolar ATP synthase subunit E [Ramularia collo-cygni]